MAKRWERGDRRRALAGAALTGPLAGLLLVACATGDPAPATQAELEGAVADASFVGALSDGTAVCIYHAADGHFLGRSGGLVSGTWTIDDGALCYAYVEGPDAPSCRQAIFNGNRAVLLEGDDVAGQGTFNEGNVCA